jgi:SAM-dependent methyltransferase
MGPSTPQQIGKVRIHYIRTPDGARPVYSDGAVEERLQRLFQGDSARPDAGPIASPTSWAEEYHLSPARHNLLKWYPFRREGSLLEIGAGCGALTGLFCDKVERVVALEYSPRRAGITALRFAGRPNLEIAVGGFQDFETAEQFDYVTIIGVLEYAAEFYGGRNPYESFLKRAAQLLRPGGHLLLAIENKIGLKYITGAAEDHTGRPFDSIYGYPYSQNVRTFNRTELAALLHAADFRQLDWYYPLPDYKLPHAVLSEAVHPTDTDPIWALSPATLPHLPRREILSEKLLGQTLAQAGLFGEFANSFLVIAAKDPVAEDARCLRFYGANYSRRPAYRTCVSIRLEKGAKKVVKIADNPQAEDFIRELPLRERLAQSFFASKAIVVTGELNGTEMSYPHLEYPSLKELIGQAMADDDSAGEQRLLDEYLRFVRDLPAHECVPDRFLREFEGTSAVSDRKLHCLDCAPVDCIPANIFVGPAGWHIIDSEWTLPFPMPVDFLIFRALHALMHDLQFYIQKRTSTTRPVVRLCGWRHPHYIPADWLDLLDHLEVPGKRLSQWEVGFQNMALLSPPSRRNFWFLLSRRKLTHVKIREVGCLSDLPYYVHRLRRRLAAFARRRKRRPALQPVLAPSS